MKVKLTYFKPSGKFYSDGGYETQEKGLWEIWNEVESMLVRGYLPDMVVGAREFILLVEVPEHPHNHPHLIIKPELYNL